MAGPWRVAGWTPVPPAGPPSDRLAAGLEALIGRWYLAYGLGVGTGLVAGWLVADWWLTS